MAPQNQRKSDGISYAMWHQTYDHLLVTQLGLTSDDLPDIYSEADAYETDDATPAEAAAACIELHIGDEDLASSWY
jgi:hypothetical protein